MNNHNLRTVLTLAGSVWFGGCADPCVDDGLLQKEGDPETCAAKASLGGTADGTGGTMTADPTGGGRGNCDNGVRDGDETDVDCGGSCDAKCGTGEGCGGNTDCQSGSCDTGAETCDPGDGACSDSTQNQDETDVDCGGVCGASCEIGEGCGDDQDCVSDYCGASNVCDPNPEWCADEDGDGAGDPEQCVTVGEDDDPPEGYVNNDGDCDDASAAVFPGAAPNDSLTDCMEDKDDDDWGDDTPAGMSTVAGTDCDDDSLSAGDTFPGAAPNDDARACMKDADGDDWGDSDPPSGGTAGTDCDDGDVSVPPSCLTVEVTALPVNITLGETSDLLATPSLGDGNYTFGWDPAASLDDGLAADPDATPSQSTTYDVMVSDGNGDQATGSVTVHVTDAPLVLNECEEVSLGIDIDGNPTPVWSYSNNDQQACETANGDPTALICGVELDNAIFRSNFEVQEDTDNDHIGFVWGYQDTQHFYLLTWKSEAQTFTDCGVDVPAGVVIKVVDAAAPLQCEDLLDDTDTPNSTVLALPAAFYDQGWNPNEEYIFELEQTPMGFTVRIIVEADDTELAEQTFNDTTYPSGRFGVYTYSQSSSCFWDVFTEGL
ncbi:MAG: hypothetical protein JKY37_29560 [Nannocystaceae bacterium]|nr:hypothetical protein [Nannocystaceae bacterium]